MADQVRPMVERALGVAVRSVTPMAGGCIAQVYEVMAADGRSLVAKVDPGGRLGLEAYMLRELGRQSRLPLPEIVHGGATVLVMSRLAGESGSSASDERAQRHMGELVADLHSVRGPSHGHERDTLIGSLIQVNERAQSWCEFFATRRLRFMARAAHESGAITDEAMNAVDRLVSRIASFIDEPEYPSLLHGDLWTGNVLCENGRVTGVIDPAIYFGHPEVELAFMSLFGCFGRAFYDTYGANRPIAAGFFERRILVYQLYPLLVHARLFGGGYGAQVEAVLRVLGV